MNATVQPSRRTLVLLVAPIVVLSVMGTVASAFAPALAAHHPLLLITLDARNRMLVLARHVGLAQFMIVACTRRMLKVPLSYALGRLYGDGAIRWLEKKGGGGALVRLTEKVFSRAVYPVVFLSPSLIVCALAGVTEMSPVGFFLTALAGTVTSVLTVRAFSDIVAAPVDSVLGFFSHHLLATTLVSVGLVALSLVAGRAQGALGPSLDELDDGPADPQEPLGSSPNSP